MTHPLQNALRRVYEGRVIPKSDWEPTESCHLHSTHDEVVWPAYILDEFEGKLVRVTIEVLA